MDQNYLQELINEANARGGGMILNSGDKPAVVVLTIDRYNELLKDSTLEQVQEIPGSVPEEQPVFPSRKILVTGGAGYVGSHVVHELLKQGYEPVVVDNLSTGKAENVPASVRFYEGSVGDMNFLRDVFATEDFYAVMHFAETSPEASGGAANAFLQGNVLNTTALISVMQEAGVLRLVYSSTADVYGMQEMFPIPEHAKLSPVTAYGYSKLLTERLVKYFCHFSGLRGVVFRHSSACGNGDFGVVRKDPFLEEVLQVASGEKSFVEVLGSNYPTHDGTMVREFLHISDLARAYVLGLKPFLEPSLNRDYDIYNIGTGRGLSVMESVNRTSEALGRIIPMEVLEFVENPEPITVTDNTKIKQQLGFSPENSDFETILLESWQSKTKK